MGAAHHSRADCWFQAPPLGIPEGARSLTAGVDWLRSAPDFLWGSRAMKIRNRLNPSDPCFSFEFFPPKTEEGLRNLLRTLDDLAPLDPGFVSVTYGAGGSTRSQTLELVKAIGARGIEAMAHVTCVGHTRDELARLLEQLGAARVENVLALRGDAPAGDRAFVPAK